MKLQKYFCILATTIGALWVHAAQAQTFYIEEDPVYLRFEQYTGINGNLSFWRLPTPGVSTFPGGSCTNLRIPPDRPEQASRFMALYLFSKTNNKKIFYLYNTTSCVMVSFGTNG
ncbi:hypothetical protein KW843_01850 [Acidovorax sp. sif1233]|jgi:hypothetical protein|uniref:hypothetical protein n=1 Tax=unclassified Acidovorax TaxID=2684926 RepID=UPI001C46780D|nr:MULTISPECIES: hypothetical protein [unclassified Acidovorax]MBV7428545.1 hypothetical protein [Acidovorax sp. sif0732]MBV7450371.1 hypothetical protein [Acidovorax sp. sif0715]MBV7453206.1 hypothetical protein [Acidovorax sp. sif1233]